VAAKADPSAIALMIEGADIVRVNSEGELVLQTGAGEIRWRKPVAYQLDGKHRTLVRAAYRVSRNQVRVELGNYDRRKALIIDPVLDYGTYIDGSTGFDDYVSLKVDSAGFAYVLGFISSTDFPTTPGAYQRAITNPAGSQMFISKLSQDGSFLVWSTIIGGSGPHNNAFSSDFALDPTGNIYIVGSTFDVAYADVTGTPTYYASTFPTTSGAYNSDHLTTTRYFLLKLSLSRSAIDYSTFLSDQPNIIAQGVALDAAGDAYVTGN
jgi:Beta-propeller repeat